MATYSHRYPQNAPGKYYVDDQCTDCDLCRETAPNNIRRNDHGGHSYVFRQPTAPEEVKQVQECVERCPCDAVGNDGDEHCDVPLPKQAKSSVPPIVRQAGAGFFSLISLAATLPNLGGSGAVPGYRWPDYAWIGLVVAPFVFVVVGSLYSRAIETAGWMLTVFLLAMVFSR
jgi:ferredoxin